MVKQNRVDIYWENQEVEEEKGRTILNTSGKHSMS